LAIVESGIWKILSLASAFLMAGMGMQQVKSAPEEDVSAVPVPPARPKIQVAPQPPPPPHDPVKTTFQNFQSSFLQRVAIGQQTAFNTCFTRTGNPVLPANVDRIRNGSAFLQKAVYVRPASVDYSLPPIIVLDPGHDSEGDPGAIRNGLRETTVVNAVAVKLKAALEAQGADVIGTRAPVAEDVSLTGRYRFKDQDRALQWRTELAYEFAAKFPERPVLAISIHADTSPSADSDGAGIFYYAGSGAHSAPSAALARNIAANYRAPGGSMIKSDNFAFLRCQKKETPAVLIELGYLTNADDFNFLQAATRNGGKAERIADRITAGIFDFIEQKRREQNPAPRIVMAESVPSPKTF
jgi:N-acetylmuramoyl-L-alanine amidase